MNSRCKLFAASSSAIALFSVLGPTLASAQNIITLDEIRVESQDAQDALGNTAVTQKDLSERNSQTIADVFAGESEVKASGGPAIAQKVFVHGIEESLLAVTIDGARQNKSGFHHTGNVLIDPAILKRVEVSSGLAPADAGPGALGGLLAYETVDARDLLDAGDTFGGMSTLSFSSNGNTFRRGVTLFGAQGGFEYLLNATRTSGDDYKDGSGAVVPGTGAEVDAYTVKLAYTTETGKRLEFTADYASDTGLRAMQAGPGGLYFARPDFAAVVGRPSVYLPATSERQSFTLTYTDERPDGGFAPTVQLSYNEQLIEAGAAVGTNTSLSGKIENSFDLGGGVLTTGFDFFHDTARAHGPLTSGSSKETLKSLGLYAQMRHDLSDRVSLSYGARFDSQQFTLADGTTHKDSGASVNASADFVLTDTLTLNAGIASSWGGYELSEASLINLGGAWAYGTPTASRANNARIGLRYDNGPWLLSGALFYTEINDIDDILSSGRTTTDLTSKGIDASLRYTGSQGYGQINWTYADVRTAGTPVTTTGYYYGRPVGHIIGLSGAWNLNGQWAFGGNAEIALKNDDTNGVSGMTSLPGYEVLNVFASYKPRNLDGLEIRFDVRNVLDEQYSSRTSDGIGVPSSIVPLTEPGRSFAITANMRF
ncbi:TonB-dependent receptor [Rhodobacteraceae bacterium D3-12]|nr:TonB-dependent receptor [Rhodobacteraceae bacterium D3-12]